MSANPPSLPQSFGYATVQVQSQTESQPASSAVLELSACLVNVAYFNSEGEPFVPSAVRYRVDDITSGQNIVPLTGIETALTNVIAITSAQNAMISLTRPWETHQVLVQITDGKNEVFYASADFYIKSTVGLMAT